MPQESKSVWVNIFKIVYSSRKDTKNKIKWDYYNRGEISLFIIEFPKTNGINWVTSTVEVKIYLQLRFLRDWLNPLILQNQILSDYFLYLSR